MNKNGKRPRDVDYPRITFHAQERTFDRLFKESSLHDLKQTVKTKLRLKSGSVIRFVQLREGYSVDLEDEDDFDAFYAVAHSQRLVNVQIELAEDHVPQVSEDSTRPGKEQMTREDLPSVAEEEAREPVITATMKRKVAFVEFPTEPRDVSDAPPRKKRKGNNDSVKVVEPSSFPDGTETPKKKKRKIKSKADVPVAGPIRQEKDGEPTHRSGVGAQSVGQDDPQVSASARVDNQSRGSVFSAQDSGNSTKLTATAEKVSISAKDTKKAKRRSSIHKLDDAKDVERQASLEPLTGVGDGVSGTVDIARSDLNRGSQGPNHEDGNLANKRKGASSKDNARGVQDRANVSGAKNVTKNDKKSVNGIDAESSPHETHDFTAENQEVESTHEVEDVVNEPSSAAGDVNHSTISNKTGPSLPVAKDRAHDVEQSERKRTVKSLKTASNASAPVCPVCTKAPRHDLIACPVVQEGPSSIQRRIKALRASKKFPDDEKMSVIDELKRIKERQKIKAKESKVNAQSHSPHSSSRLRDEEVNEIPSNHMKGVAGVSKQSHSVNSDVSSGRTSSNETPSLGSGDERKSETGGGNEPLIIPGIGDVSDLANVDLDTLVRGPENAVLSVNDLPSSEESDEDVEKMSGGTEDEAENQYPMLKSLGDGSSDSEDSNGECDDVMDIIGHAEDHATITEALRGSSGAAEVSPNSREQNSPQPSRKAFEAKDTDNDSSIAGNVYEREASVTDLLGTTKGSQSTSNKSAIAPDVNQRLGRAEELAAPLQQTSSPEHESVQLAHRRPQQIRISPVIEDLSENLSLPIKGRTRSSVKVGKEENGSTPMRSMTKTLSRGKGVSLSEVSDVIQSSAVQTRSSLLATSPSSQMPTNNHELRTPGRRSVKLVGKINLAKENANETHAKLRKRVNDKGTKPSDLMAGRSQDQEAPPASMPVSKSTALASPSRAEDSNSSMNDELVSGSPSAARSNTRKKANKANGNTSSKNQSLFTPSHSQNAYLENPKSGSDEEGDPLAANGRTPQKYRRLSEISGQTLFVKHPSLRTSQRRASITGDKADLYGKQGKHGDEDDDEDDDEDGDSGSDSDSEVKKKSHIPKTRRAGA